ncbi:helix-turn-helix domain-containing protein [Macellibacteroides fermentans]
MNETLYLGLMNFKYSLTDTKSDCNNFTLRKFEKNGVVEYKSDPCNVILFVMQGEITVTDKSGAVNLKCGRMLMSTNSEESIRLIALEDSVVIVLKFYNVESLILESLLQKCTEDMKPCLFSTETICPELFRFLSTIEDYIKADVFFQHLFYLKLNEFFGLISIYYTDEAYSAFLSPLLYYKSKFRFMVLSNYEPNVNVIELAKKCNMSIRNFSRRFTEEFGMSPGKWLMDKKDALILESLSASTAVMTVIAENFGFASSSHFSTYCKKRFNDTPYDLHKKLKSGMER